MIALEQNFRSTGHILQAANAVIAHDSQRLDKTLFTAAGDGDKIEVVAFTGSVDEARGIAAEIGRRALERVPYDEIAILYRFNFLSRLLEEELIRLRIPYEVVGDTSFWQRAVIKDALAFLRLAACPDEMQSDEAFRRVVNLPARGVGAKSLAKIEALAEEQGLSLFEAAERLTVASTQAGSLKLRQFLTLIRDEEATTDPTVAGRLRSLVERTGFWDKHKAAGEDGRTALENLSELLDLAAEFQTLEALLDHAALGAAATGEGANGRVKLMTIHGAKGLEFPHVFLMGWEDRMMPSPRADDPDEERRLAYVALTRARRRVSITWCGFRNGMTAGQSPYLDEIPEAARHTGWLRAPRRRQPDPVPIDDLSWWIP